MTKRTERKDKKAKLALLVLLLAIAIIIGTSLAFFSDYGLVSFSGQAGNLSIEVNGGVEDITAGAKQYWTAGGVAASAAVNPENLNPGDYIVFEFDVENTGGKSAWVRATLGDVEILDAEDNPIVATDIFKLLAIPSADMANIGGSGTWASIDVYMKAKLRTLLFRVI